jgi:hypothetical protein
VQELIVVLFLPGDNGSDTTRAGGDNNIDVPPFNLKKLIEPSKQSGVATRF